MEAGGAGRAVSARAVTALCHAEAGFLLGARGVPVLHVKGPSVAALLYPDDDREWGDPDLLVARADLGAAVAALRSGRYEERVPGGWDRLVEDHAVVMVRPEGSSGGGDLDLHHRFPGIGVDPDLAFAELWRRREPAELAHTAVWFPDTTSRALLVALNTARSPTSDKAREDLRRALDPAHGVDWPEVVELARRLDALPALRAGLELEPAGRALVAADPALRAVEVGPEWRMRTREASLTALRLGRLRGMPWRRRPVALARWVVPPREQMWQRDLAAPRTGPGLVLAYLRRLGDGLAALPRAVREASRARR